MKLPIRVLMSVILLVGALAMLGLGPHKTIICNQASWPNTMLGHQLGIVDGVDFTGCVVPTRWSWATIALLLIAAVAVLFVRTRSSAERTVAADRT